MGALTARIGRLYQYDNISENFFLASRNKSYDFGDGICFIERYKPYLIKCFPYSYKGELDLLQHANKLTTCDSLKSALQKYKDLLRRSTHIISHINKPWQAEPTVENLQPKVSLNRGHRFVMALQGAVTNYKDITARAKNDVDALYTWLLEEHYSVLNKIEGCASIMFSHISKNITPSVFVFSTNIDPLYHIYYRNVHFISSNKDSLYLFEILENDIKIDTIPQDRLFRYTLGLKDPLEIKITV